MRCLQRTVSPCEAAEQARHEPEFNCGNAWHVETQRHAGARADNGDRTQREPAQDGRISFGAPPLAAGHVSISHSRRRRAARVAMRSTYRRLKNR